MSINLTAISDKDRTKVVFLQATHETGLVNLEEVLPAFFEEDCLLFLVSNLTSVTQTLKVDLVCFFQHYQKNDEAIG